MRAECRHQASGCLRKERVRLLGLLNGEVKSCAVRSERSPIQQWRCGSRHDAPKHPDELRRLLLLDGTPVSRAMRVPYVIATHSQYRNIWLEDQPVQHCLEGVCTRCAQPNTIDVLCPAVIWHAMGLSRRPKEPLPHRAICASRTGPLAPPKTAELFCSSCSSAKAQWRATELPATYTVRLARQCLYSSCATG